MALGHNQHPPACWLLAVGGSYGLLQTPFVGFRGNAPGSFGYLTDPRFSNSLTMHHLVTLSFPCLGLFLPS